MAGKLSHTFEEKGPMLRIYGDSISGNCLKVKWVGTTSLSPTPGSRPTF